MSTIQDELYGVKKGYIDTKVDGAQEKISQQLYKLITESKKDYNEIVLICIGTDRSAGDCFAPMLGTFLSEREELKGKCKIYGSLQNPVHAKNLEDTLNTIDAKNSLIIAIDACLGSTGNLQKICIANGTLTPGAAFNKELPSIGDISIAGIVNISGAFEFMVLQNTRIGIVYEMVRNLEVGIISAINKLSVRKMIINDKVAV
ncbi:spore protease YyaC [Clostridium sp. FP2]|uniref:spore protease YyaC n=1 Tax=Clostridium sp. FP2 TaxID=2724481 RepID=UPI0013E91515|nr:spore protease YyaC [Clostridium sp. FP2]MBZ9622899.1 spore protease YyaC [Clostridium sp. FP2]